MNLTSNNLRSRLERGFAEYFFMLLIVFQVGDWKYLRWMLLLVYIIKN